MVSAFMFESNKREQQNYIIQSVCEHALGREDSVFNKVSIAEVGVAA